MKTSFKRLLTAISVVAVAAGISVTWRIIRHDRLPVPDEKAAAMELLARKLSGPGYFNLPLKGIREQGGPWIPLEEVSRQKDRVTGERKFGEKQRAELDRLISELSEPQPERMVGGYRVQLERLNLAVDGIKLNPDK
ncbi:MAG: hypothetical protein ABI600_10545 [Luteolibacter sp.]